jgi:hypothetical protein
MDFHLLNSWNYAPYEYVQPDPIVLLERADDDPPTPDARPDLFFRIPDPRNFKERLATSLEFEKWLFTRILGRPWGPGIIYELGIYLLVHLGVSNIVTLGWDLGELNTTVMEHFFHEESPDSNKSDGIMNIPRIRPFEVSDIAESTRALYYWLRSRGIRLFIVSDRSLVDPVAPRISASDDVDKLPRYRADLVADGDFTQWSGDRPGLWYCTPAPERVAHTTDTPDGRPGVELKPATAAQAVTIFQQFRSEKYFLGGLIKGRMDALSHDPGRTAFTIALMRHSKDADPIVLTRDHPGDGQWHCLEIDTRIPADVNITQIKFIATHRGGAEQSAIVRHLEAILEK